MAQFISIFAARVVRPLAVIGLLGWTLLALNGCSLSGQFKPIDAPQDKVEPDHYRSLPPDSADNHWPDDSWWREFHSPELNRLIQQAHESNFDLSAAASRIAQADAKLKIAGASLLPSLDASANVSRDHRSGAGHTDASQARLSASYEVDFWGKNRSSKAAAQALAKASYFDRDTIALSVDASVAQTYFKIAELKQRLKIAQNNLKIAKSLLGMIEAQNKAGTGNQLDVAQQKTQVANRKAAIAPIKKSLDENINALAVLIGKPPAQISLKIDTPLDLAVPDISAGLPSQLLTRRPDIAKARAELIAAGYDVLTARASRFPSFNLTAEGGWRSLADGHLFSPRENFWNLTAGLTQPIFDAGRLKAQQQVKQARYDELVADYQNALLHAFEDVDNALSATRQSARLATQRRDASKSAQQAFVIAQAQLARGVIDMADVLNVQQALYNAHDDMAQAYFQRLDAAVSLFQALGGGWSQKQAQAVMQQDGNT